MKRSFFYITVIAALFTGIAVKVQAQQTPLPVPENLRGHWAAPDCGQVEEVLALSAHGLLFITGETLRLSFVRATEDADNSAKDYNVLEIDGAPRPVSRTEDGILAMGEQDTTTPPANWPAQWQDIPLLAEHEYTGCHETPALAPAALDKIMKYADTLYARCAEAPTQSCRDRLFRLADRDNSRDLNVTEMQDAGGMLVLLDGLVNRGTVRRADVLSAHESAQKESRVTAHIMMTKFDADRSGTLDRAELETADFTALPASLRTARHRLGKTFAGLRGK